MSPAEKILDDDMLFWHQMGVDEMDRSHLELRTLARGSRYRKRPSELPSMLMIAQWTFSIFATSNPLAFLRMPITPYTSVSPIEMTA
jgi:hypothetical protein